MSKQLFLLASASSLGGTGRLALGTSRGGSSTNAVTNTVTSGTNIQCTDTAGGNPLSWWFKLGPCTIAGNVTANIRGLESALTANAGAGLLIEHFDVTGTTNLSTVLTDRTVPSTITEYTTSDAAKALAAVAPTSTTFTGGEWLKVTLKVRNVGTMSNAAGETVTNSYNGPTASAAGDTSVTFVDNLPTYISGILGIDKSSTAVGSNAAPLTKSITLDASTALLICDVSLGFNPDTATLTATYNGTAMTSMGLVHADNATSGYIQRFKLQSPATGSAHNLVVTPSAGTGLTIVADCTWGTWTDSNNFTSAFGSSATAAVTLSSTVGKQCLATACGGQAFTAFAGFPSQQLMINTVNTSSAAGNLATAIADGASSVAFSATLTATDFWGIVASDLITSTGSLTGTAAVAETASVTSTGVVGAATGASVAETATVTSAGAVGVSQGATLSETTTVTSAGAVGAVTGSAVSETATVTSAGTVGAAAGAAVPLTAAVTAAGVIAGSTGASVPLTGSVTSAGVVGASTGSSVALTATFTAAGSVGGSSPSAGASIALTVTATPAGVVGAVTGSTVPLTASITAGGVVGTATGSALGLGFAVTTAGTLGGGSVSTGAAIPLTDTISSAGVRGAVTGASVALTAAFTATGVVGTCSGASLAYTVTVVATLTNIAASTPGFISIVPVPTPSTGLAAVAAPTTQVVTRAGSTVSSASVPSSSISITGG